MAKQKFQVHSAYNVQDWLYDGDEIVTDKDDRAIVDTKSSYYDRRSGKAPLPHSIVVDQKVSNYEEIGALPELLTAQGVKNLGREFKELVYLEEDYPLNTKDGINGVETTTRAGHQVIRYYYKIPRNAEGVSEAL